MRSIALVTILLCGAAWDSPAQSSCPGLYLRNTPSASLAPSPNTLLYLQRQGDGSYASYETSINPYQVLSITPHFEKQLTTCVPQPAPNPAPLAPANPAGAASQPQAVALLNSGQYLVVAPVNSITGTVGAVATLFDQQLNLVSSNTYEFGPAVGGLSSVSLADVNGDGNLDLVGTGALGGDHSMASAQLIVMLGRGGSLFGSPTILYQGGLYTHGVSVAIGDLNGDQKPDIALAVAPFLGNSGAGTILFFRGNGDGTFQAGSVAATTAATPNSVAIADLNADRKPDLVISTSNGEDFSAALGNQIAIAMGKGDGTFQAASYIQVAGNSLAIGDMNADGIPDIVTNGTLLFGDGKGSFPTRQDYQFESSGSVILADFDGDGRTDVVVAQGIPALIVGETPPPDTLDGKITVLFAQPDGTFWGPALSVVPGLAQADAFITDLRTADFNSDGIPDLIYAGDYGIGAMIGKGDGTFTSSFTSSPTAGWEVATGDFDRDGKQDIVAIYGYPPDQSGVLSFFAGKGDGTFQTPIATPVPPGPDALATGDFNGDGKLDLAISFNTQGSAPSTEIIIFLGNGDGSFHQGATYQGGGYWIVTGDLNSDGKPDLVVTGPNSIATLLGKGDGTFAPAAQVAIPVAIPGNIGPSTMSLADFNHDGTPDVVVLTKSSAESGFAVLLGKGDGTFQAPLITSLADLTAIGAAELNFDGAPDLVVAGEGDFNYAYLLGNGDGSFQTPTTFNLPFGQGGNASALLLADLNRDGWPDLVSTAFPLGFFSLLNFGALPPSFQVVSSASFAIGPVAPNSFVTAFGTDLPTSDEGAGITVTDSAGELRPATVLFSSSTQLNFFMPAGVKAGPARVDIRVAINGPRVIGYAEIAPIAPGLFTENAAGLAAAYAVRVDAMGNQSFEPIFTVQNGQVVAAPIDLGSSTEQVFLCLFGTGFDAATANTTTATVAGQSAQVTYAGPQGEAGLDQVNVLLPRSLAGSGDSLVVLSVNGAVANAVHIAIQ